METDRILDEAGAAQFLSVRPQTLAKWRCVRRGPRYIKVGARVRYRVADLQLYLTARTVDPSAPSTKSARRRRAA